MHQMIEPALHPDTRYLHSMWEDVLGMVTGTLLVALGMMLYARAALLVGVVLRLAQLLAAVSPVEFWIGFFVLNLPLYRFAWRSMRRGYVARTLLAVTLECGLTRAAAGCIDIAAIDPVFAAITGGALVGIGQMCLFRHNTSLGGIRSLAQHYPRSAAACVPAPCRWFATRRSSLPAPASCRCRTLPCRFSAPPS